MNKTSSLPAVVVVLRNLSTGVSERHMSTGSEALSLSICQWLYHVCNAKCFNSNKDDLPEKIGRNHCLRIQNVHLWLMCVAQKPPRLSSLFTWSPHWDSREINSNQLLWPNNKYILIDHLPWLAPMPKNDGMHLWISSRCEVVTSEHDSY